ncbi:uncharacterized protein LOC129097683 [Anoplopoma fimbria]|uniref:uncharacterized protein LOC129097683 n=1 Tax=Anoplopoma fimbria TaxID=229290 RepID=UPI0023EAA28E|nr:uncharacterized protein LOC129097683 [Anoplopoma fimbria]
MADPEKTREQQLLKEEEPFRRNAFLLIEKMLDLYQPSAHAKALVDEILHSIFFCGKIHNPPFSPEMILIDVEIIKELKDVFPRPFELFSSRLPRRGPFSCVLDMIVHLNGGENENKIIDVLRTLITDLKLRESMHLVSSTICFSHKTEIQDPVKYYGVSNSAPDPRRIMYAASCLGGWDSYVAGAVMTYLPKKKKKPDFDGTIVLPSNVRCHAFSLSDGKVKSPCRSCGNLFGLTTSEIAVNEYGNCAEVESLSNLFKNVVDVKEQARPTSEKYSDLKRAKVEKLVRTDLRNWLLHKGFPWDQNFYTPQPV